MLNRRTLLKGLLATPIAVMIAGHKTSRAEPPFTADYGVASGDPRPNGMVLWTRVPEAAQPQGGGAIGVQFQVAMSSSFEPGSIVLQGEVATDAAVDYTVKVLAEGLEPATRYFYRFTTVNGYHSAIGRTKTAPAPDTEPDAVSFAFVSCQRFTDGFYPVFARLALENVDFCAHLGDAIYEGGTPVVEEDPVRQDPVGEATTLAAYRQKYQLYLSDPYYREVRRRFPWVVIWDDHELFNNYAGAVVASQDPQRQREAYTAFLEYTPIQPVMPLNPDGPPSVQIYRQFSFGTLLEIFALDARQYRDGTVCERDLLVKGCPELDNPNRTMLGLPQRGWLQASLASSQAHWKCVLNQMMMMRLAVVNQPGAQVERLPLTALRQPVQIDQDVYVNLDAWDGYPVERAALLQWIADQRIANVVVCSGDFHNCYAGLLRPDFTNPESPVVAVEILGGSVTSYGLAEYFGRDLTALGRQIVPRVNPHIAYLELKHHVYTKVVVTPGQMQASYIAVRTVTQPVSQAFVLQRFTIPDGESRLISA
jgi:alkaline phosphatase D